MDCYVLLLALTTAVVFVPYVNTAFGFANENGQAIISWQEYIISLALAFSIVPPLKFKTYNARYK